MRENLIVHQDPKSPISEIFRTLRTNIQFLNSRNTLKSVLVTSTSPAEGKSWVTANLAVTFAQAGKRVVIVDADMRKGRQYAIFEVSPRPGLSNYLSGIDMNNGNEISDDLSNYIQDTQIPNLYIIPAGNITPNPSELLISTKMVSLLDRLKELCDLIIIDGTPSELVTDSIILSRIVDSTVIVTAHKQTKKDDLQKIVTNIQNVGGKIAGIVLNKVPVSAKKYEQSYYYGSTSTSSMNARRRNARVSNIVRQDRSNSIRRENRQDILQEVKQHQNIREKNNGGNENKSNTMQRKINIENKDDISLEKTTDILNQINEYLDKEKKNLNNN